LNCYFFSLFVLVLVLGQGLFDDYEDYGLLLFYHYSFIINDYYDYLLDIIFLVVDISGFREIKEDSPA